MDKALKTKVTIPLSVPVPVDGADGKPATRSELVMKRPKLREAKRLAALVGQDLLTVLLGETGGALTAEAARNVDGRALVAKVLGNLLNRAALDELTALIADMCGEKTDVIDELDLVDLVAIGEALAGFFPALPGVIAGR